MTDFIHYEEDPADDAVGRILAAYLLFVEVLAGLPLPIVLPAARGAEVRAWRPAMIRAWALVADEPMSAELRGLAQTGIAHWLTAMEMSDAWMTDPKDGWQATAMITNIHYAHNAVVELGARLAADDEG